MTPLGYAHLIDTLKLNVLPLPRPAAASPSVNRRVDSDNRILFPSGVAIENTLVGHLEFALRHQGNRSRPYRDYSSSGIQYAKKQRFCGRKLRFFDTRG